MWLELHIFIWGSFLHLRIIDFMYFFRRKRFDISNQCIINKIDCRAALSNNYQNVFWISPVTSIQTIYDTKSTSKSQYKCTYNRSGTAIYTPWWQTQCIFDLILFGTLFLPLLIRHEEIQIHWLNFISASCKSRILFLWKFSSRNSWREDWEIRGFPWKFLIPNY